MSNEDFDVRKMWRDADPAHRGAVLLCITSRSNLRLSSSTAEAVGASPFFMRRPLLIGITFSLVSSQTSSSAMAPPAHPNHPLQRVS